MIFEFIKHKDVTRTQIEEIIKIKNEVWSYPFESHLRWINDNLHNDDYHLIIKSGNVCIGYLNIVNLIINGDLNVWGIGNVCVSPNWQGQNIGLLLMKIVDYFLVKTKTPGVLICKDHVKLFYIKCGWTVINNPVECLDGNMIDHNFLGRYFRVSSNLNLRLNRLF